MQKNWLQPDWEPGLSITNVPIKHFIDLGIKVLVLDVDGTLLPRTENVVHNSVFSWVKEARDNFSLHLLSNNPSRKRIESISRNLNINFTYKAAKPTRGALREVVNNFHLNPHNIAIIGDRLFTDILAGNRLGLYTVLVKPLASNGNICKSNRTQRFEQKIAGFLGAIYMCNYI